MSERRTSSQVSVICRSHDWLEVEEERECSSWEKEEVKVKKASSPREDPCSPLYQTRGAGYISEERNKERDCACTTAVRGEVFSHAAGPTALGSCWLLLPCVIALDTWCMHR
jgi:hypothetical protein